MMKRAFLINGAVGLLLSTAAIAQSPSTNAPPAKDQNERPSASEPAAKTEPRSQQGLQQPTQNNQQRGGDQNRNDASSSGQAPTDGKAPSTDSADSKQSAPQQSGANSDAARSNDSPANPSNQRSADRPQDSANVNASLNINDQQRTKVGEAISRARVQPVTNINFSVSVGTVVPSHVAIHTLPADVVSIVPQFRGYSYFVAREDIVIVEPSTHKIVMVLPRTNRAAAAPAPSQSKRARISEQDREVVRKHSRAVTTERRTEGSTAVRVKRGDRLPESVVIEEFPEAVYRDAPALRDYRYIRRDRHIFVVDPTERMVIEEID